VRKETLQTLRVVGYMLSFTGMAIMAGTLLYEWRRDNNRRRAKTPRRVVEVKI